MTDKTPQYPSLMAALIKGGFWFAVGLTTVLMFRVVYT